MKKILIAAACVLMCGQAVAQQQSQQEFTLKLTNEEMNVVGEALGQMPFNKVAQLLGKLRQQVIDQQSPKRPIAGPGPVPPTVEPEQK